jgi:hypothetical protein
MQASEREKAHTRRLECLERGSSRTTRIYPFSLLVAVAAIKLDGHSRRRSSIHARRSRFSAHSFGYQNGPESNQPGFELDQAFRRLVMRFLLRGGAALCWRTSFRVAVITFSGNL